MKLLPPLLLLLAFHAILLAVTLADSTNKERKRLLLTNDIAHANGLSPSSATRLSPVIMLPGDGGSRLQAKLDRLNVTHKYCERKTNDWFDLWLNLSLLVPFAFDCWLDNMKLEYNYTTRRTQNSPGVSVRVKDFGKSESVEYVDPAKVIGTGYFDSIVRELILLGYERNKNIFGAPYDFRRAPNELEEYFTGLKGLVEKAYEINDGEPVVFICHSMGCLHGLYFLNSNTQAWKDKYMRSMISLAGVWGGSVKAMKAFASGDNFGVAVIPTLQLRKDVRTFPSLAYLMPAPELWPSDKVLVRNRNKQYTVTDYKQFFIDIKHPVGYEMWLDVRNLTANLPPPNIEVHCLHGNHITTIEELDYPVGDFPDAKPRVTYGDGDGTVNLLSLQACASWAKTQKQPFYYRNFTNIDHMTVLTDPQVLEYIGEALTKKQV